jgi:hypothetical protein
MTFVKFLEEKWHEYLISTAKDAAIQGVPEPYKTYNTLLTHLSGWAEPSDSMIKVAHLQRHLKEKGSDPAFIENATSVFSEYRRQNS